MKALRWLALIGLSVFALAPFWLLVVISLKSGDVFKLDLWPQGASLAAYAELFRKLPDLPRFFLNSAILCALGVTLEVLLAALAAYPLARLEFRGKTLLSLLLLATLMLPVQANMIVNFVTIRALGLYDTLLAVVLPSAVSVFGIFLMRQAFLVIPRDLEDAARVDGCNDFWIWRYIMLPLSRPALGTLALLAFIGHWNSFMWPLIVLKSRALYPLPVGLSYMAHAFDAQFRLVAAGSVLAMLPMLLMFLGMQRQFIEGLTTGAVK